MLKAADVISQYEMALKSQRNETSNKEHHCVTLVSFLLMPNKAISCQWKDSHGVPVREIKYSVRELKQVSVS